MLNNILILLASLLLTIQGHTRTLASIKPEIRVSHARELMGARYGKSVVSKLENKQGIEENIFKIVEMNLPKAYKTQAHKITDLIIEEATKHQFDPYFVMAVISGESSFNPLARGPVGEIGLMQVRPSTGKWMADIIKFPWKGDKTLEDPAANIKLGTAYMAWLRTKFSGHGQLYLAAYNMGAKSVKNALGRKIMPKDYPIHVMKRYIAFYREANATL
jgi:soluble lytic murein transglycosylase